MAQPNELKLRYLKSVVDSIEKNPLAKVIKVNNWKPAHE